MRYVVERRLHKQAGSYLVALPKIWVEAQGLKGGDPVSIAFNGDGHVVISPPYYHSTKLVSRVDERIPAITDRAD